MKQNNYFDIIIVGGGIMGICTAWFLRQEGFLGSIVIVEKDNAYVRASSTLSAGGIRQQFSEIENISLSQFGLSFLKNFETEFGTNPGYQEQGYLVLADKNHIDMLEQNCMVQKSAGASSLLLGPIQLSRRFPFLSIDNVGGGILGEKGDGWFDPYLVLMAIKKSAKQRSVEFVESEVVAIKTNESLVESVMLANGSVIGCSKLINAAGPAAGMVSDLGGIKLPVEPRKRTVFSFDCKSTMPAMPLTVDISGVWVRPESTGFICGVSPPGDQDGPVDVNDFDPDYDLFEDKIWPVLANRIPVFESIKMSHAWVGHYEYNRFDQNAIIGPHPNMSNFYFINGFSGHGIQQAPAAGRAVAEHIVYGGYKSIDCSRFSYDRILNNKPFLEKSII